MKISILMKIKIKIKIQRGFVKGDFNNQKTALLK